MMQQGLGALMPQQPAGQAPENPVRMAAAMDVVTSDAEEQVLDPRTLALIKYKDAVAAMQAADQLMAASQPTLTPPTVAERTKLAAQQGIMGLASRLAPGLQQQGSRMGAAQAQQAMTGGLAQLPAPNMAGMAGGGIVGYAEGGAADADIQRYTAQYRAIMAAVQNAGTPEQKAQLQQRLREIQSTFDPETIARAHMQMSGQGMAAGGEVQGFQKGGLPTAGGREDDYVVTTDELGNPIYASDIARALAAGTTDTSEEGATRRADYAALQAERPDLSELARTPERPSASTERAPTTGYGMRDRTGQGSTLAGMGQGVASLISDAAGGAKRRMLEAMSSAPAQDYAPTYMTDSDIAALGRQSEADRIAESDAMIAEESAKPRGFSGNLAKQFGLGSLAERAVQYTADNPAEAAGNVLLTGSGAGIGLKILGVGATKGFSLIRWLAKNPTISAALSGLALKYGDSVYDLAAAAASGDENAAAELERAGQSQTPTLTAPTPTVTTANAAVPAATTATAPTATTPTATTQDAVETLLNQSPPTKTTTGAGQSRDSRDERLRRVIAGLRGLGAEGVGGYAAGSAGEEQRLEQELIAGQERQRTAGMEERELGLRDREVTLMDELRRDQLDADIRQRSEQALLRLEALGSAEQQFVQEQIGERTKGIDQIIDSMNLSLITGNVRGGDADELRNQILALQEQKATIIEEALIGLEQPDRSAAIRAAEEAAYGSGGGSGMSEKQRSLLNMYAPQE